MRRLTEWTSGMEAVLRRMRNEGETWAAIGLAMGLGREVVREHGRRIGAPRGKPLPPEERIDRNRPPLPAGHPLSWTLLTRGTCLDGTAYPYPVFL